MKKIPLRTCIVSHEKLSKYDLVRVVKDKDNHVFVDQTGKANGHGVYLKKDLNVINTAKNKNILARVLEVEIPSSIYEELNSIIGGEK